MIAYQSINQHNTSLEERETYYQGLQMKDHSPSVLLQTCNRVELYYGDGDIPDRAVSHSLAAIENIDAERLDLSNSHITIIGVNKLTADILKFLKNKGAQMVFLANRSQIKAHQLADPLGIQVFELHEKRDFLTHTDILISATSAPHTIIHADDIPSGRQLLAIDLAFPRDIDATVGTLPGVRLYNITDVEQRVRKNIIVRRQEVERAEKMIDEAIAELQAILRRRKNYSHQAV